MIRGERKINKAATVVEWLQCYCSSRLWPRLTERAATVIPTASLIVILIAILIAIITVTVNFTISIFLVILVGIVHILLSEK